MSPFIGIETIGGAHAFIMSFHQPGFFQLLQVLGYGGLRQRHILHNFSANTNLLF